MMIVGMFDVITVAESVFVFYPKPNTDKGEKNRGKSAYEGLEYIQGIRTFSINQHYLVK